MSNSIFLEASALQAAQKFAEALPSWEKLVVQLSQKPERGSQEFLYTCLYSLGECHSEMENYEQAISVFEKVIDLATKLNEEKIFIPQSELAWLYNETDETKDALRLYDLALKTADEEYRYYIYNHLTEIFQHADFSKAMHYCQLALDLVAEGEDYEKIFIPVEKLVTYYQGRALLKEALLLAFTN